MSAEREQSAAEWAASLTVADLELILNRCVKARDFHGLQAALRLMAAKDPATAEYWRDMLLLATGIGKARIASSSAKAAS